MSDCPACDNSEDPRRLFGVDHPPQHDYFTRCKDDTMPERLWVFREEDMYDGSYSYTGFSTRDTDDTEYIRADVAQAQLDAANARIAELEAEYKLHREASLADFLKQSDEHSAEIKRLKSRVAFDCRQLLSERDARIAELEAAQRWVSVDEWLPDDESKSRLAWTDNDGTVTHWMPLPPPPHTDEEINDETN